MKKIDLGQTVGILTNVGVIAGIILLAIELRQNNELMAAEARFNRISIQTASITLTVEHPDLAELIVRSQNGGDLTPAEVYRLQAYWRRLFVNMQWTYQEAYDDLPLETWKRVFRDAFVQDHWENRKTDFIPEFVEFVDENVVNER